MRCVVLITALLAVIGVGCDGHTKVHGRVVDPEGEPIPEATVKFTQQSDTPGRRTDGAITDENGYFDVAITHAPSKTMPFLLEVSKEEFVRHEERLTGTATYEKEIILHPVKK
jgi:hypothetical protein